jgi:hypothetical protein
MITGVDRGAEIRHLRVLEKSGGRSGAWYRPIGATGLTGAADAPAGPGGQDGGDAAPGLAPARLPRGTRGPRRRG